MNTDADQNRNPSIPTHLLWRSILGPTACWSGSRRGRILDSDGNDSVIRHVCSDRRMFYLNYSLRDCFIDGLTNKRNNKIQLLPHPKIVNAIPQHRTQGIICMDLDRGNNESQPPRHLLVGSGGDDCSLSLYDLSYFGSEEFLYQKSTQRQYQHYTHELKDQLPLSATHKPIARSIRSPTTSTTHDNISGHRHPLLSTHWYPVDTGSFVSTSISGEILVWDTSTFTPVYNTTTYNYSRGEKQVNTLQCVDLPKSTNGALLALGLGGANRSAIQLCDVFSGGTATHELLGHEGGVNTLAWDPGHSFRLASGGEDGTVRLWDVRKGGWEGCLGVLDGGCGYYDEIGTVMGTSSKKRQRMSVDAKKRMEGVESHSGPVTSLAFVPGGEELVSCGTDGIKLWDLRPDSCHVSSIAANIGKKRKCNVERGGMDPAVACGGRLFPCMFGMSGLESSQKRSRRNKSALAIVQDGSRNTTTLFATQSSVHSKGQIAAYSLFNNQERKHGEPNVILSGHLDDVTCLTPVIGAWDNLGVGCYKDTNNPRLLSAGKDGIILSWGVPSKHCDASEAPFSSYVSESSNRSGILSVLQRQRQHRLERLSRQYRDGVISGREYHISVNEGRTDSQGNSADLDCW